MSAESATPRILIVEDDETDVFLLEEHLSQFPCVTESARSVEEADAALAQRMPDLILLDLVMPGKGGKEFLAQMRLRGQLQDVAVIVLSGMGDSQTVAGCLEIGADDHLTKPFSRAVLFARMRAVLAQRRVIILERQYRQLAEAQNERLEALVALRTTELKNAHARLSLLDRIKGDFLQMIAHEIRTPLNGVLNVAELAFESMTLDDDARELRGLYEEGRERLVRLLDDALLLNRLDDEKERLPDQHVDFATLWEDAEERAGAPLGDIARRTLRQTACDSEVSCDPALLVTALSTVLTIARKLGGPDALAAAVFQLTSSTAETSFPIRSTGLGRGELEEFFEVHSASRSWSEAEDLGLAPVVAHRILSLYGGNLRLEQREGQATLVVTLPLIK